ncbi:PTS sugar transporter subunit IIB [Enorma massiliensis]|uniref:PTS sugar transporter subunit IIB n=1 Tax=Enorma massiliensis TaxID=1472761 RepID=UPI003A91AFBD
MSEIVGARVDERLIHGQVATAWTNHLKATRIMVIEEDVVKSSMDKQVLKMACPANCKLSILRPQSAVTNLASGKYDQDRIFIVCKRPRYFLYLMEEGVHLDRIILGNMSAREDDAAMLRRSVYVTRAEAEQLARIEELGAQVFVQQTPTDKGEAYKEIVESKGGQLWD